MKIAIFLAIFAVANFAIAFDNDEDGKLWGTNEGITISNVWVACGDVLFL
jgi:hypothetical protein